MAADRAEDVERRLQEKEDALQKAEADLRKASADVDYLYNPDRDDHWEPSDEDWDPRPSEVVEYEEAAALVKRLKNEKIRLEAQHRLALEQQRFESMAEASFGPRTEAMRRAEARLGWAATVSLGALSSYGIAGRLMGVPLTLIEGVAVSALAILGAILSRYVTMTVGYGFIEFAAKVPQHPEEVRRVHRVASEIPKILPWLPVLLLGVEVFFVIRLAAFWIYLLQALAS